MKPILIVVSTHNRRDLTGITLDSIARNKTDVSDVVILDDDSQEYDQHWLLNWGWPVIKRGTRIGVGAAAQDRFKRFVNDYNNDYILTLDNDLLVSRGFDDHCLDYYSKIEKKGLTVFSGYHSVTQTQVALDPAMGIIMSTINGISQFCDRATAKGILKAMPDDWRHPWDRDISKVLDKIVVPTNSMIQHLGIHGSGVNGPSKDVAVNFRGDQFICTQS